MSTEVEGDDLFPESAMVADDGDDDDAAAIGVPAEANLDRTRFLWNRLPLVKDECSFSALDDVIVGGSEGDVLFTYTTNAYADPVGPPHGNWPIASQDPQVNFYDALVGDQIEIHLTCTAQYQNTGNAQLRLVITDDYELTPTIATPPAARAMIGPSMGPLTLAIHWVHTVVESGRTQVRIQGRNDANATLGLQILQLHMWAQRRRKALIDSADV